MDISKMARFLYVDGGFTVSLFRTCIGTTVRSSFCKRWAFLVLDSICAYHCCLEKTAMYTLIVPFNFMQRYRRIFGGWDGAGGCTPVQGDAVDVLDLRDR